MRWELSELHKEEPKRDVPRAHFSEVVGLLESIKHFGGRTDLARIAAELKLELDDILPVVDAAESLGFVKVDSGDIALTEDGHSFLDKGIRGKKLILREKLGKLQVFQRIASKLCEKVGGVPKEQLLKLLRSASPDHDPEATFKWVIEWGRHGVLLKYDARHHVVKAWPKAGKARPQQLAD